jgi:hypothetical protein
MPIRPMGLDQRLKRFLKRRERGPFIDVMDIRFIL